MGVEGQHRSRPLSFTLAAAQEAGVKAGVTRLADVTGLGGLGVPTFQAVRPWSRSLSVSQGKGLTVMAAAVSALLEAVELDSAERLPPPSGLMVPLRALGNDALTTWSSGIRKPGAIALDPEQPRLWLDGYNLANGRTSPVPFDLACLDATKQPPPDVRPMSVGLATGNTIEEALTGAVAEVVEHDLMTMFDGLLPAQRREMQLDTASVTDPLIQTLLFRFASKGFAVRVWSIGQGSNVAAFRCTLWRERDRNSDMAPVAGSGCHSDRRVALLRALLEAAQAQATLVAGARDDLLQSDYIGGASRQMALVLDTLSFGPGQLAWADVRDHPPGRSHLDALLEYASNCSTLPVIAASHPQPHSALHIVHAFAPGLRQVQRLLMNGAAKTAVRPLPKPAVRRRRAALLPVVFAGPSLPPGFAAPGIELRSPAVCGDLAMLLADPPPAVGLIDGCFEVAPTVWHKEILDLLARGVPVLGGASLGAIRAAELAAAGMRGIGAIFFGYASGAIRRDDAVMIDHAPVELGYRHLTVALVDAEAALWQVDMPSLERRALQRIVRTASYHERTWSFCLRRLAEQIGQLPTVSAPTFSMVPSLKRKDALALIATISVAAATGNFTRLRPPLTADYLRMLTTLPQGRPPVRRTNADGVSRA
ncbi:YcaO-like family protein [Sphingomonas sp. PB2P19]|uniref:YcaO-like family protein n=1 Tax=Sphingomonas rhamnosi TaxID=3096156 RepID=UPI003FA6D10C